MKKEHESPKAGATFRKLWDFEAFENVFQGIPVPSFKEAKEFYEENKDTPMMIIQELWWKAVAEAMRKVREDCKAAQVDFTQDDFDKIAYFANKMILGFSEEPRTPILMLELLKHHYDIDFSGLRREEMYEKMFGVISEAVKEKKKRK